MLSPPQTWPECSKGWTWSECREKHSLLQSGPIIFISFCRYGKTPDRAKFSPQQRNKISRFTSQSHTWWCYTASLIDYKIIQRVALFLHLQCSFAASSFKTDYTSGSWSLCLKPEQLKNDLSLRPTSFRGIKQQMTPSTGFTELFVQALSSGAFQWRASSLTLSSPCKEGFGFCCFFVGFFSFHQHFHWLTQEQSQIPACLLRQATPQQKQHLSR